MDSSRLRIPNQNPKKVETPAQFKVGDKCLARWTDSRKFPGTVHSVLENSKFMMKIKICLIMLDLYRNYSLIE